MLYWLTTYLQQFFHSFRVFQYITFRSILASLTALAIALLLGPPMIKRLSALQVGQVIRDDGPRSHRVKAGTPTMGGALILVSIALSALLWGNWADRFMWVVFFTTMGFGAIGLIDDYRKLVLKNAREKRSKI